MGCILKVGPFDMCCCATWRLYDSMCEYMVLLGFGVCCGVRGSALRRPVFKSVGPHICWPLSGIGSARVVAWWFGVPGVQYKQVERSSHRTMRCHRFMRLLRARESERERERESAHPRFHHGSCMM